MYVDMDSICDRDVRIVGVFVGGFRVNTMFTICKFKLYCRVSVGIRGHSTWLLEFVMTLALINIQQLGYSHVV